MIEDSISHISMMRMKRHNSKHWDIQYQDQSFYIQSEFKDKFIPSSHQDVLGRGCKDGESPADTVPSHSDTTIEYMISWK